MIKLSQLPDNAMLTVSHRYDGEIELMDKADFLQSSYFLDYPVEPFPSVTLADKQIQTFDLFDVIERIGEDDTYEGWDLDVYNDIRNAPETEAFLNLIRMVFERHPTFWEGNPVEIDMVPGERGKEHEV